MSKIVIIRQMFGFIFMFFMKKSLLSMAHPQSPTTGSSLCYAGKCPPFSLADQEGNVADCG